MTGRGLSRISRQKLTELFKDRADYVLLREGTKHPAGTYRLNRHRKPTARVAEVPRQGNYGVIPVRDFIILDLDVHRVDLAVSQEFFAKFFGVDLEKTFSVRTPSGGIHYYLRIPPGLAVFNGSLRSYPKKLSEMLGYDVPQLDADLRSSDAAGYALGPGSYISKDGSKSFYTINRTSRDILNSGDFSKIEEISQNAASVLAELRVLQKKPPAVKEGEKIGTPVDASAPLIETRADPQTFKAVQKALQKKVSKTYNMEYHRQRAYVSAVMRCCYSDYTIAVACIDLGIDLDSYSKHQLSMWKIINDLKNLRSRTENAQHSPYCPVSRALLRSKQLTHEVEENVDHAHKSKVKIQKLRTLKFHRRNPRVVHVNKVVRRLNTEKRKKVSQVAKDAMLIIDIVFQPLHNVGAKKIVLAAGPVSEMLGLTKSRLSAALRLLRDKEIVLLVDRQRTGMAPTYAISDRYVHHSLTSALRYEWIKNKGNLERDDSFIYDRFSEGFINAMTGEFSALGFVPKKTNIPDFLKEPEISIDTFVQAYLKRDLKST